MRIKEIKTIKSVLSQEFGSLWLPFLLKCIIKKRGIFNKTHWARSKNPELKFVKRLSLVSALYLELQDKFGKEKAFEIAKRILVPIGCDEQMNHLKSLNLENKAPMERLMAFNNLMDEKGVLRFNRWEYIKHDENTCNFIIQRCIFHDFFTEVGTPELTKLFCEIDRRFFPKAFPEFEFHRNGSWENTLAYGKDHCEFVFERKMSSPK